MQLKSIGLGITVISSLVMFPSAALAQKVFCNPRIDGLEVDRCITSYQYPDGCSKGATGHAATMFCQTKGYSRSTQWEWRDESDDNQRSVYKLL